MKWMILVSIIIVTTGRAQTARPITVKDAVTIGFEHNKILRISSSKVDMASAKASEVNATLLPSMKFEGSYKRVSDVEPFQIQPPGFPVPFVISPSVPNTWSMKVTLQQPLFTGFKLQSNARTAEYLSKAAEAEHRNDRLDLSLNIIGAYWMLYQATEAKHVLDENVNRLQSYQKDAENLLKAGMATRNDLLKIQVQLSNARLAQIDATNDVEIGTMNLNNLIGQPLETELQLLSTPERVDSNAVEEAGSSLPHYFSQALRARPDIAALGERIDASKASVTAAESNFWPQLFLIGSYAYNRPNARYQPTQDQFNSSWDVGVQVQFDLWNWGMTSSQADQAKASLLQGQLLSDQLKENIGLEVKKSYLAVLRAKEKVDVARLATDQAGENARSTRDKFKAGLATSSELLDANLASLQATTSLTASLVERELARARLRRSIGEEN